MENTLGKRIAALRRQKELTQDNLAQILDVSSQAVSKWENDQTCPDISLLPQLASVWMSCCPESRNIPLLYRCFQRKNRRISMT